jgi:nucleotide-binding universal stress UspA family protein
MTMTSNATDRDQHAVVVGVDGSQSALRAVRWAAHEARRRAVSLRLVHVGHVEPVRHPRQVSMPPEYRDAILEQGRHFLDEARDAVRQAVPDLPVVTDLHTGPVVGSLVNESKDGALMVLGSRGLGGFGSLLLGSVAVALAAHGHCPVVVMHAAAPDGTPPVDGPVVVGVDGAERSDGAVTFAFEAAAARNLPVLAVHTYDVEVVGSWTAQFASIDWDQLQAEEEKRFVERITPWREKFPRVETRTLVLRGRPADALVEQGAQLIMVGSRGHGALTGLGLGSVSQTVLHHAECPVAVVRTETTA